jgi:hypothetical protein
MNDVTIIYYTSNKEDPEFEKRVQENLLQFGGVDGLSLLLAKNMRC